METLNCIERMNILQLKERKHSILFHTMEGRVFQAGMILTLTLVLILGYYGITDPVRARTFGLVFFAHSFGGRAAGIGLCIMDDLGFLSTVLYNFFLEIQIVCVSYSLFVLSINNYINIKWMDCFAIKMMRNAEKHKEKIRTYGWLGLFIFVMLPLPVTGPVIGSILGYLLRIPVWRNFSAIFLGTFCAIVGWVICFDFLEQHLHAIQYILVFIIVFVIFSHIKTIRKWFSNKAKLR